MGRADSSTPDLLRLEVFHHLFAAVGEEMGESLKRSAFSPNIKERRDYSCALFDAEGRMIGQAAHLPVHLGAAPMSALWDHWSVAVAMCQLWAQMTVFSSGWRRKRMRWKISAMPASRLV